MPASTFELISEKWEDLEKIKLDIIEACEIAELKYQVLHENEIVISIDKESTKQVIFELRNNDTLEWYYSIYPSAKEEPVTRIPYFLFLDEFPAKKHYSIALANNYFDYELIYMFSKAYFSINPNHFISINGKKVVNKEQFEKTPYYVDGWWNNIQKFFRVSNYNV